MVEVKIDMVQEGSFGNLKKLIWWRLKLIWCRRVVLEI